MSINTNDIQRAQVLVVVVFYHCQNGLKILQELPVVVVFSADFHGPQEEDFVIALGFQ